MITPGRVGVTVRFNEIGPGNTAGSHAALGFSFAAHAVTTAASGRRGGNLDVADAAGNFGSRTG